MLLSDKVCVVVGAGSPRGIGYATVRLFLEHGGTVVGCDRTVTDDLRSTLLDGLDSNAVASGRVDFLACDITRPEDCARLTDEVVARFGQIDSLVNCAGIVESRGALDISPDSLDTMMAVNLKGAFILNQAVLRHFVERRSGSIVNVASVAAQRGGGLVGGSHYAASKGGLISLTRSLAREFGPSGIRANIVAPSMTETGMLDGTVSDSMHEKVVSDIPLRRAALPRDIAGACLFLASDLSAYITGATIDVNGGSHIH